MSHPLTLCKNWWPEQKSHQSIFDFHAEFTNSIALCVIYMDCPQDLNSPTMLSTLKCRTALIPHILLPLLAWTSSANYQQIDVSLHYCCLANLLWWRQPYLVKVSQFQLALPSLAKHQKINIVPLLPMHISRWSMIVSPAHLRAPLDFPRVLLSTDSGNASLAWNTLSSLWWAW